jgi:coenzyme Q-binding protein COQ10
MPRVEVDYTIAAKPDQVYELLSRMEDFPQFMSSLESLQVVERGDGYTVTDWVARLQGARFHWMERDEFLPDRIVFQQTSGDLKVFEGEWRLEAVPEGTRVTLVTDFEFGIPMLASLLNPVARVVLRDNSRAMLEAIARRLS